MINDPDLHIVFKSMIEDIIKNCERDIGFDKVYNKYKNMLNEINKSSDSIKFVIDLSIKYNHRHEDDPEKLEKIRLDQFSLRDGQLLSSFKPKFISSTSKLNKKSQISSQ
ncbi:9200_t:CDS:2 [Gigaspora rosea]|nr:9200_t:CDS:2 [Gigaspora rosea]